jgi:soluble lytic murein transglycosylase-like protein
MTDSTDKVPSRDAVARRRRMHRRHAKRHVKNVFVTTAVVFTLAVLAAPEASPPSTVGPASAGIGMLSAAAAVPSTSTLPIQPLWRRPGDVLKRSRGVTAVKALPFGLDPKERERRESLGRWHRIYTYSATYRIKPELARRIYDAATTAGIEPELGFRLIRVESVFDTRAVSSAGALGLTQLMLGTAREFEPRVTREQLLDPDVNLRIGFKYLRGLIREYKGDLKLALLVYNRGPVAVQKSLSMGMSPANGYESIVTKGYRGRGYLD